MIGILEVFADFVSDFGLTPVESGLRQRGRRFAPAFYCAG
jgi:hypothetical protein